MSGDYIKTFKLEVEIQENGIIRDPFGWIIGRCDDDWLKLVTRHELNSRAERTCRNEHGHCSMCGAIMYDAPNYCPNCGCKVVSENGNS